MAPPPLALACVLQLKPMAEAQGIKLSYMPMILKVRPRAAHAAAPAVCSR